MSKQIEAEKPQGGLRIRKQAGSKNPPQADKETHAS